MTKMTSARFRMQIEARAEELKRLLIQEALKQTKSINLEDYAWDSSLPLQVVCNAAPTAVDALRSNETVRKAERPNQSDPDRPCKTT